MSESRLAANPASETLDANRVDANRVDANRVDVVVVGAGLAGLYILYCLRERGLTARAFEAGSEVGGTWYWNRYP
ncbi:MAG: NAD(P)-binding protein, partial [Chromatiales bacterium]|nr:NAD(P)-binding protein [Chromatiales bacterium]